MADVSIIICASQSNANLENSVRSCFEQTHSDCEVLVVGNNREAESDIKKLVEINPHFPIRYVHSEIPGSSASWNAGIKVSTGRYAQLLRPGDLLHQQKIETQISILKDDPELDMCYCFDELFQKTPGDLKVLWNTSESPFHLDRFLWLDPVWSIGSPLWRKSFLDLTGFWNEELTDGNEYEYNVRALCSGIKYFLVPRILHYVSVPDIPAEQLYELSEDMESKKHALVSAYDRLVSSKLLTTERADAISAILLLSAEKAFQSGRRKEAEDFGSHGAKYAAGGLMKLAARWMNAGYSSFVFRYSLGAAARRLLLQRWEEKRGLWKLATTDQIRDFAETTTKAAPDTTARSPFATVIIPTYKRFRSLELTLQDLSRQTAEKDDFEIFVVDNACSAETAKIVDKVKSEQRVKIEYIPEPAPGAHNARHTGARKAKGEILIFLDDDMRVEPVWLSAYIKEFKQHSGMAAAGGQILANWEQQPDSWILNLIEGGKFFPPFGLLSRGNQFLLSPDGYFFSGNMAVSAKVLFDVGGFNPDQLNDVVMGDGETGLHKKLWKRGFHIGYIPEATSCHFIPSSKMNLEYLLKWSKNWGISSAYGEYSKKILSTPSLVFDAVKRSIRFLPYWVVTKLSSRRKLDSVSVHRQMYAVCILERLRFVSRLILNKNYRKFVQHQDWLNHPMDAGA